MVGRIDSLRKKSGHYDNGVCSRTPA
jgi:hypothetical protein